VEFRDGKQAENESAFRMVKMNLCFKKMKSRKNFLKQRFSEMKQRKSLGCLSMVLADVVKVEERGRKKTSK
jgi:hypothetical protein